MYVFILRRVIVIYATFVFMLNFNKQTKPKHSKQQCPQIQICYCASESSRRKPGQLLMGRHFLIPNVVVIGHQMQQITHQQKSSVSKNLQRYVFTHVLIMNIVKYVQYVIPPMYMICTDEHVTTIKCIKDEIKIK